MMPKDRWRSAREEYRWLRMSSRLDDQDDQVDPVPYLTPEERIAEKIKELADRKKEIEERNRYRGR